MRREYDNLVDLIKDNIGNSPETADVKKLFKELKDVKKKGFLTRKQFFDVAMSKSPRPKRHYMANSEKAIIKISKSTLLTDSEDAKMTLLTSLKGVSIPVASALLTIIDPKNYGVMDIRVWQLLYLYGAVETKPKGQGFNVKDWKNYLSILRKYADISNVNVRDVERTFFFHHVKIQEGLLYKN
jgi:thermostable 8-oxoguanine DNA glycosylase